eukprot:9948284-Karenia_brevis.AAC.1
MLIMVSEITNTNSGNTEYGNIAPTHGNKRAHISPTQPVAPQLPPPFGGEAKAEIKKAKVQADTVDAGVEKTGKAGDAGTKDAEMEAEDNKSTQAYPEAVPAVPAPPTPPGVVESVAPIPESASDAEIHVLQDKLKHSKHPK